MPRLADKRAIRAILETDRGWAIYALGDLEPGLFERGEWFAAAGGGPAIALVYRAFATPVLFTLGEAPAVGEILDEVGGEPRLYLSVRPEVLPLVRQRWAVSHEEPMWRMILEPASFRPEPTGACARLRPHDAAALQALYADGEGAGEAPGWFDAAMLEAGVFFGVRERDEIIASAGTHVVAQGEGVAAIGHLYVRRDRRGRGLAGQVTSAVALELLRMGIETIGLNVAQRNAPALRVYERLGFARHCPFYEGVAERAPSTPTD